MKLDTFTCLQLKEKEHGMAVCLYILLGKVPEGLCLVTVGNGIVVLVGLWSESAAFDNQTKRSILCLSDKKE